MKPGQHPEFYRFPAPKGRSRESTIVLDGEGRFWHDGKRVEHDSMNRAFSSWISRHPDDGRFILENGYDWTYFRVVDVPFFIRTVRLCPTNSPTQIQISLSDGSTEVFAPETAKEGERNALYCLVKGAQYEARFMPGAQNALAPVLIEADDGIAPRLGTRDFSIGKRFV